MNAGNTTAGQTRDSRLGRLEAMMLIRAYEQRLVELQKTGAPGTPTSIGQEAAAVGVVGALEGRDRIVTNHRSGEAPARPRADPLRMMAEVLARADVTTAARAAACTSR